MNLRLPLLCCLLAGSASASSLFEREADIKIWGDGPIRALEEINAHLPPHERLAWFADGALDETVEPGPVVELEGARIGAVLNAYCEKTGLEWGGSGRAVWLWRPAEEGVVNAARAKLLEGEDRATKAAGANALHLAASPAAWTALFEALAKGDEETRDVAYRTLASSLVIGSAGFDNAFKAAWNLLGDADRSKWRIAPPPEHGLDLPAPWAAFAVLLEKGEARDAIASAIDGHGAPAKDLPLLLFGALGRLESAEPELAKWFQKPGEVGGWIAGDGWQQRYLRGRAKSVHAWAHGGGDEGEAPDYDRRAAELRAYFESLDPEKLQQLRADIGVLAKQIKELEKNKKENKQKIDQLKKAKRGKEHQLRDLEKKADRQVRQLREFDSYGKASAQALVDLVTDTGADDIARITAAEKLAGYRLPSIVPPLIDVARNDQEPKLRQEAYATLGHSRQKPAIASLREDMADPSSGLTRRYALRGLVFSGHPQAGEWILARLAEVELQEERNMVIQFLGGVHQELVGEALAAMVEDGTAPIQDRLSATAALSLHPTGAARTVMRTVVLGDHPAKMKELAIEAFIPQKAADVPRCLPDLLAIIEQSTTPEVQLRAVEGTQLCANKLDPADPRQKDIAGASLALVVDREVDNNVRKTALNTFKYTAPNDDHILQALETAAEKETHPVMRTFFGHAIRKAR